MTAAVRVLYIRIEEKSYIILLYIYTSMILLCTVNSVSIYVETQGTQINVRDIESYWYGHYILFQEDFDIEFDITKNSRYRRNRHNKNLHCVIRRIENDHP